MREPSIGICVLASLAIVAAGLWIVCAGAAASACGEPGLTAAEYNWLSSADDDRCWGIKDEKVAETWAALQRFGAGAGLPASSSNNVGIVDRVRRSAFIRAIRGSSF